MVYTLFELQLDQPSAEAVLRLEGEHFFTAALLVYCIHVARHFHSKTEQWSWYEGCVYTVFACFGGGIISPLLVNEPPFPLRHDLAIPFVALAFGLTRLKVWRAVVDIMPVKVAVGIAFECIRWATIVHWTKAAQKNIEFDSYFGGPVVFGPIVVGTIAGSGGSFFFRDGRTLLALENKNDVLGMSWLVLSALLGAAFFHLGTSRYGHSAADVSALCSAFLVATRVVILLGLWPWGAPNSGNASPTKEKSKTN